VGLVSSLLKEYDVENSDNGRIQLLSYMMKQDCPFGFISDGTSWKFVAIIEGSCYALHSIHLFDVLAVQIALIFDTSTTEDVIVNFFDINNAE
jgi:hypothetical protein